jgi:hypothetical protein
MQTILKLMQEQTRERQLACGSHVRLFVHRQFSMHLPSGCTMPPEPSDPYCFCFLVKLPSKGKNMPSFFSVSVPPDKNDTTNPDWFKFRVYEAGLLDENKQLMIDVRFKNEDEIGIVSFDNIRGPLNYLKWIAVLEPFEEKNEKPCKISMCDIFEVKFLKMKDKKHEDNKKSKLRKKKRRNAMIVPKLYY